MRHHLARFRLRSKLPALITCSHYVRMVSHRLCSYTPNSTRAPSRPNASASADASPCRAASSSPPIAIFPCGLYLFGNSDLRAVRSATSKYKPNTKPLRLLSLRLCDLRAVHCRDIQVKAENAGAAFIPTVTATFGRFTAVTSELKPRTPMRLLSLRSLRPPGGSLP
jgi:hypothetical protein